MPGVQVPLLLYAAALLLRGQGRAAPAVASTRRRRAAGVQAQEPRHSEYSVAVLLSSDAPVYPCF